MARVIAGRSAPARLKDGASFVRKRVQVAHHRLGALVEHMRIDLRRRNIGVAEQVLHDAQIGAVLQQVAGESVTQDMRADARGCDAGGGGEDLEFARESLAGEMAAVTVGWKQPWALGGA